MHSQLRSSGFEATGHLYTSRLLRSESPGFRLDFGEDETVARPSAGRVKGNFRHFTHQKFRKCQEIHVEDLALIGSFELLHVAP